MLSSKSAKLTVCGKARPCLCLGGAGGPSSTGRPEMGPMRLECSSSPSESSESSRWSSKDVRGDSGCAISWKLESKIECRESEDVSVPLLLLSGGLCCACDVLAGAAGCDGGEGAALPPISMFVNASTSIAGLPAVPFPLPSAASASSCPPLPACSPNLASLVASVRANGLYGIFDPPCAPNAVCGGAMAPVLLLVFSNAACSASESAVAVVSLSPFC